MVWIQTYTGRQFFPLEPRPEDIDLSDIAHSLSLQCRFSGHCLRFYSVAEHSVRVSHILSPELAMWGLLHDAAEAYLTDLPRPVKQRVPEFQVIEDRLLEVIVAHFGLTWPMPEAVAQADSRLLATEARDLMVLPPESWGHEVVPLDELIEPWAPGKAEWAFLDRYRELRAVGRSE